MRQLLALTVCLWAWSYATAQVLSVPSQYGTIAAAIAAAAPGQIVEIAPGTYFEHDLDFAGKAITVRGVGPAAGVVINAQSAGRGFQFRSGEGPASVLEGVTIRNGLASETIAPAVSPHGGGILCLNSAPLIRGCRVINCRAQDFDELIGAQLGNGGGIAVVGAAARIENCLVEGCSAGSYGSAGCGIWVNASGVVVQGTTVRSCTYAPGGPAGFFGSNGCGIFASGSGNVIEDCIVESNGLNGTVFGSYGYGYGGGLNFSGTGQIRRTRFEGNRTPLLGGGAGAYIKPVGGAVLVEDCVFRANATSDGYVANSEIENAGDGAGLYVDYSIVAGSIEVRGCDFIDNQCGDGLGNNPDYGASGGSGGGMLVNAPIMGTLITRCRFVGNRAGNGIPGTMTFDDVASFGGYGGGILLSNVVPGPTPIIEHCEFFDNRAGDGAFAAVPGYGFSLAGRGGAITTSPALIRYCTFADNLSGSTGGIVQPFSTVASSAFGNSPATEFIVASIIRGSAPSHVPSLVSVTHSSIEGGFFGVGNIDVDPMFVDRARGNLHLAAGSPMIGAVPNGIGGIVTIDVDGESRPSGAPRDMGADQFLRMGTADDIELRTRIANRGRGTNAVIAPLVGEPLTLTIDSPGGTFDGLPVAVAAQGFSTAAPITPNPAYDFIHLSGSIPALLLIDPGLAPAGLTLSATTPAGLGGFVTRVQAFVAAPNVQNGIIATTAAHDIVWP